MLSPHLRLKAFCILYPASILSNGLNFFLQKLNYLKTLSIYPFEETVFSGEVILPLCSLRKKLNTIILIMVLHLP